MKDARFDQARRIFGEALEVDTDQRTGFVLDECRGDAELRQDVEALLRHHELAGSFLEDPTVDTTDRSVVIASSPRAETVPPHESMGGLQVAGRYTLGRRLGAGGCGVVYEADDALTGTRVAVKLLSGLSDVAREAVRREVATLRLLRMPGVVQLLDDGMLGDLAFIVMELVEGDPFPGKGRSVGWADIGQTVLAVLDTLARIHWAGVIHRDLKPSNVLVKKDGTPVVLDMGISAGPAVELSGPDLESFVGTPKYVPPEQWFGAAPSARGDLYSLGVMLYESLGGEIKIGPEWQFPLGFHRPIEEIAPETPTHVARLVARLLSGDPSARPESAVEARALLSGEVTDPVLGRTLPRIGDPHAVDELVHGAKERRSVDISGAAGSGRTRCLLDACAQLEREGYEIFRTRPDPRPFGSLIDVVGELSGQADERLASARGLVRRKLTTMLESGCIIVCDDFERLDRWSRASLEDCRSRGCMLRAFSEQRGVVLQPLTTGDLRSLFAGPSRIHHVPDDAALELWRRTHGCPASVATELSAWVRAGLARWEGDTVVITRIALERLRAGLHVLPPGALSARGRPRLPDRLEDLLVCIDIAGAHATVSLLQDVLDQPRWTVEADVDDLAEAAAIRQQADGRLKVLVATHAGHHWTSERRQAIHRALASSLEPGAAGRFYHLIAADMHRDAVHEAMAVAEELLQQGHVDRAMSVTREGLATLARDYEAEREEKLLTDLLHEALMLGTADALDIVLYHLGRARCRGAVTKSIERIARAALLTTQGDADRALDMLDTAREPSDAAVARWRHSVRVLAASYCSLEEHESVVTQAAAWAAAQTEHAVSAARWEWLGWLAYRKGHYGEAARLHAQAAQEADIAVQRASALLNAAWASLEAFDLEAVERLAREAEKIARECRHAHREARAQLLRRSAAYRRGDHGPPDRELVEATRALGVAHLHGLVTLNEAAVAWRRGQRALARELATESIGSCRTAAEPWGELLARALAFVCGHASEHVTVADMARAAGECPLPGIAAQVFGLLSVGGGSPEPDWAARLQKSADKLPRATWPQRREVASIEESVRWSGGADAETNT